MTGLTSNPTIFQKAIASGDYDADIAERLHRVDDAREVFFELAIADVQAACTVLDPVFAATAGADGFVSLEVDPGWLHDSERTLAQALDLHGRVDRRNLYVKIPATREGLLRHRGGDRARRLDQRDADLPARALSSGRAGLPARPRPTRGGGRRPRARDLGRLLLRLTARHGGRRRLDALGRDDLAGKLGIANARLAYAAFEQVFAGPDWERLAAAGAAVQRPLWASTSTKNPAYRDTMYVEELIGPHTVNTMPPETLEAFRDHGEVRGDTVCDGVAEAEALLDDLAAAGVDYDEVVEQLEREGREVRRLLRRAHRRHRGEASRAGGEVTSPQGELVASNT